MKIKMDTIQEFSCVKLPGKEGTFLCIHYTGKRQTNKQKVFHFPAFKTSVPRANYGDVMKFELLHL